MGLASLERLSCTQCHTHHHLLAHLQTRMHLQTLSNNTHTHTYKRTQSTNSEEEEDDGEPRLSSLESTDWARGRRLKKLHGLLHMRVARVDFMRFKEHMFYLLGMLLAVQLALFIVSVAMHELL